jgi:hypothetical protein
MRCLIFILVAAASALGFPSSASCDRHEHGWHCRH